MASNTSLQEALSLLEDKGEADAAARKFQAALDEGVRGAEAATARVGLARVKIVQGQPAEAESLLRQALKDDANCGEAHTYLGVLALQKRDLAAAEAEMRRGAQLAPDSFAARYNLANVLARQKQLEAAVPEYEKAVRLGPKSYQARFELGMALLGLNRTQPGVEALIETLKLNPGFVPAAVTLTDLALQANKPQEAAKLLMGVRAFGNNAADPAVLGRLVQAYQKVGDMTQALRFAQDWVQAAPQDLDARNELALLHLVNGDLGGAEAAAKSLAELGPKEWQPQFLLGMIYETVKQRDLAKQHYARAAELGPNEWKAFNNLGKMLVEEDDRGLVRQGVDLLQRARAQSGEAPGVVFNLALGYVKLGDTDRGQKLARQVASNAAAPDEVRRQASDLVARLG